MTIKIIYKIIPLAGLLLILIACTAADPAPTVEQYIQAKAIGNEQQIRALICSEMEASIEIEALTFKGIEGVEIKEMSCQQRNSSDVVECTGRITALYGSEVNEFPLTNYKVVQEDNEWKWCGEAE